MALLMVFSARWKEAYLHLVMDGMQSVERTQNTLEVSTGTPVVLPTCIKYVRRRTQSTRGQTGSQSLQFAPLGTVISFKHQWDTDARTSYVNTSLGGFIGHCSSLEHD